MTRLMWKVCPLARRIVRRDQTAKFRCRSLPGKSETSDLHCIGQEMQRRPKGKHSAPEAGFA